MAASREPEADNMSDGATHRPGSRAQDQNRGIKRRAREHRTRASLLEAASAAREAERDEGAEIADRAAFAVSIRGRTT